MGTRVASSLITTIQREVAIGVAIVGCIALQLFYIQSLVFGIVLYVAYIVLVGSWWKGILTQRFGVTKNVLILWCLGIYAGWLYTTLIGGIASTWYGITPMLTVVCLTVSMLTTVYLRYIAKKRIVPVQDTAIVTHKPSLFRVFPASWMMIVVYAMGWIFAIILLWQSQSIAILQSPWQTIASEYLWVYFGISVILGCIILSRHRVGTILTVIIAHSLLLHAYLPLSQPLPWGGDVWRNIAVEDTMRQGDLLPPVLVGSQAKWKEVAAIDLPEALVIPHKYAYGQLWSSVTILGQITTLSSLTIHRWLMPFMWSILVPILFFLIGKQLYRSYRMGLLAAVMTLIPFTFQALGSLTIAVSTGYVTFFFIMMLWLIALPHKELAQKKIIWVFLFLGIWSYSLHTLILAVLLGTVACYQYMHSRYGIMYPRRMSMVRIGCLLASISIIPIVEYLLGTIHIPASVAFIDTVKQIIGQFSGWYYATAIRPHDILSGNIWFNHTPLNAYVSNIFTTVMRWYIRNALPMVTKRCS